METPSELSPPPTPTNHPDKRSNSTPRAVSQLRFPTPATDNRVSTWVDSISAANMSARSEDGSTLGESSYEFIDTDTESRDDNATESIASTDFARPDDVASLADTERSGEESGDEEGTSDAPIPGFPGFHEDVGKAFDTPTIGCSAATVFEESERPLAQSIEFEEPFSLGAENVSVKHTVADFNETKTTRIAKDMNLENPPKRLVLTIRQTMTKQGLFTRDPLRILYVGSHSAKQDIIHKLASSVTASTEGDKRAQHLRYSASQLYNVVPVSAFGSERTPEIELMHSSGYQIKVEDCVSAQTLKFEDSPEKPDVIKLTLEDNFSYHSVPDGDGFTVEPHWELPHIAVFYCSDSDDADATRTRTVARKFMSRHFIPSVVISHKQLFNRGRSMSLDQHSIHMCLESRDRGGRGNVIHQRLPIDLASFLNIDARQMNRNLAYLTGLHEPLEESQVTVSPAQKEAEPADSPDLEKTPFSISDSVSFIRNRSGAEWRALMPVGLLLLSVFAAVLTGVPSYRFSSKPAISINSKTMSTIPISTTNSLTEPVLVQSITLASSVTTSTATHTVTVTQAHSVAPNSLSVFSSVEVSKASQKFQTQPKFSNKSVCSAQVLGDREILIRIPSATKLSWLNKEAMSVNITRGNEIVDTERAYSSDDGIVLLLSKEEAYGVMNVSVITTKKPRVNETFQLDFGTPSSKPWQCLLDNMPSWFSDEFMQTPSISEIRSTAEKALENARIQSQVALNRMEDARKVAMEQITSTTETITDLSKAMSLEVAKRSAILSKEIGIQVAEAEAKWSKTVRDTLQEPVSDGLFKAQVRSRLLWLKMQGNEKEYRRYEKAATEAAQQRAQGSKMTSADGKCNNSKKCQEGRNAEKKPGSCRANKAARKESRAAKRAAKNKKP